MMRTARAGAISLALLVGPLMAVPTANAAGLCSELGGVVEPDGMCQVHETKPNYTLDMSFPIGFPSQQTVDDFLTQTRTGFLNETQTPNFADVPYAMDMKSSLWSTDTTRSVSFEIFQDLGGAHPDTWYQTFNYDTARNRAITFGELFAPGVDPMDAIFAIVEAKLTEQLGAAPPINEGDGKDPAHYRNFAISETDLIFFFDRGELMPGAAGAQTVQVPRNAIPPLAV